MSLHTIAFMGAFALFACLILRRSSWGIPLYMLTFYASPLTYSWGAPLAATGLRWTLTTALIFAVGVFIDPRPKARLANDARPLIRWLMILYLVNCTIVHFLWADDPERSWEGLVKLYKMSILLLLMMSAIRDKFDFKILAYSLLIGAGYVGYEVVYKDSGGGYHDGRLWLYLGGLYGNHVTTVLLLSLPLGGWLFFCGNKFEKLLCIGSLGVTIEVLIRANSRGAFLGLIAGALFLLVHAKKKARAQALLGLALGVIALFVALDAQQTTKVFGRFVTIFAPTSELESSAAQRLDFWRAGARMLMDHPQGAGFEAAFESDLGQSYIAEFAWGEYRSVHNGYLAVATSWGIQGLILYMFILAICWRRMKKASALAYASGDIKAGFLGSCLGCAIITQLVASIFGALLWCEWILWWMAMAATYANVFAEPSVEVQEEPALPDPGAQLSADFGHKLPLPQ